MTSEFQSARHRILQDGWNTTCYQILNPGIRRWHRSNSVVGYVEIGRRRIVAGAPVCPKHELKQTLLEFERESGEVVCYFGAEDRLFQQVAETSHYSFTVLGAQPVWKPQSWCAAVQQDSSLRAQLNRARNKGVQVKEWDALTATEHPALRAILASWLQTRGLPEMHFLVEPDTLGFLLDRRMFIATQEDRPIGFVTLCPIPTRKGWLTEQFVRIPDAPNGTVELMLHTAVEQIASEGAEMMTMGMVPLSQKTPRNPTDPAWLKITVNWVRQHGRRFYNFDGLQYFKDKFHPDHWDPIYVITTERQIQPKTLYAITKAFTRKSPLLSIVQGSWRAIKQEARWLMLGSNSLERHRH